MNSICVSGPGSRPSITTSRIRLFQAARHWKFGKVMRSRSAGWRITANSNRAFTPYLRRQRVRLRYALLDSTRVSVLDGGAEIPVRRVQPVDNAHRSRAAASTTRLAGDTPQTGLNAAELILARAAGIGLKGGGDE